MKEVTIMNLQKNLANERRVGSNVNYFMIYANMTKELAGKFSSRRIHRMWIKNRQMIRILDSNKEKMLERNHNSKMKGFEKVRERIEEGGIFFSYHYGNYRSVFAALIETIHEEYPEKKFNIVVDKASFEREPSKYEGSLNIHYLVSEDINIGIEIAEELAKGNFIGIFLDGNTGYSSDRYPIDLTFVSSKIRIRSGIFRMMESMKKPIYPVMALGKPKEEKFQIMENIYESGLNAQQIAEKCYSILLKKIEKHPEYWRLWYKHDKQVIKWSEKKKKRNKWSKYYLKHNEEKIYFDINTGEMAVFSNG